MKPLTQRQVEGLKPQPNRYEVRDPGFPSGSLSLRIEPSGAKGWYLRYRNADGRQRRLSIGPYPIFTLSGARERAREIMAEVHSGRDPAQDRRDRRAADTFGAVWARYMAHVERNRKDVRNVRHIGEKDLLPTFRHRKLSSITRADILELLDGIVNRGAGVKANRVREGLGTFYSWCVGRGLVDHNPVRDVPRPSREQSRDRWYSVDEIRALWPAWEAEDPLVSAGYKLRLWTGQRTSEILRMEWEDVDLVNGTLTIPKERSKNRRAHTVPLSKQAVALLESLPRTGAAVFGGLQDRQRAIGRIRERSGVADFRAHDLRRTCATHLGRAGVNRLVISRILNHTDGSVTAIYDRADYMREMRAALQNWADSLDHGKPESNMISFQA